MTSLSNSSGCSRVFVVHHNPNNGKYGYRADPDDAVASAEALIEGGEATWVAGNCHRMIRTGHLLLFKFGGSRLKQQPGIYAAARVTRSPVQNARGEWLLRYRAEPKLTRWLIGHPIVEPQLGRMVPRSFGASIQPVAPLQCRGLELLLGNGSADAAMEGGRGVRITHGLLIMKAPLDKILAGTKTWEIRGKATTRRGPIALIESKSGHIVGTCDVVGVVGPLPLAELRRNADRTGFLPTDLYYATTYAWVLERAKRLPEPVRYLHPPGAVIWVRLDPGAIRRLSQLKPAT